MEEDALNEQDQPIDANIQLELSEDVAQGHYSNLMVSNFSREEFVLDYAFLQPQNPRTKITSRVVVTPGNLKKFVHLLAAQIADYETKFGPIEEGPPAPGIQLSFN
jgi:hypothetical protein